MMEPASPRNRSRQFTPSPGAFCPAFNPKTGKWEFLPPVLEGKAGGMAIETQSCGLILFGGGTGFTGAATSTYQMLVR